MIFEWSKGPLSPAYIRPLFSLFFPRTDNMDHYRTWISGLKNTLTYPNEETLVAAINVAVCVFDSHFILALMYEHTYSLILYVVCLKTFTP